MLLARSPPKVHVHHHTMVIHVYFRFHKIPPIGYCERVPDGRTHGRANQYPALILQRGSGGGEWMVKNMRNLVSLWYTVHVITTTYTSPPSVLSRDCCIVTSPCRCTPARAAHTSCNSSDPSQGMWRPSPEYVLLSSRRTSGDECLVSADTRSGILPQCRMLLLTIENDEKHLEILTVKESDSIAINTTILPENLLLQYPVWV